ncbi:MAG: hypothetical protein EU981_01150 [Candidatus Liberibacter ctenarytainae]|uniref:SH3b domain-containing protein n=1 Tax=Candidatus Liberibacter ctenarytainae TaxID=2020335 RepID=A0A937DKY1_9HYPH|nr:hypothetical protein [Candidatus Liberibacter ctenarytainae]
MLKVLRIFFVYTLAFYCMTIMIHALPQDTNQLGGGPIPRFATIKSNRTNLRLGPGTMYGISYVYIKQGIPVEIIQEYENWQKIRDFDGTTGWINKRLLSSKRTAIVSPWSKKTNNQIYINLYQKPILQSTVIAKIEPRVLLTISECSGKWCLGKHSDLEGWVMQNKIWGIYPGEVF